MNFIGTTGNDVIDQAKLGLTDWSTIYGNEGDDTITIGIGIADGGIGQDTLIGTSRYSTASYGDSPKGVVVNLATGFVQDGFGTLDRLTNIRIVQGNGFDDSFIGSAENEMQAQNLHWLCRIALTQEQILCEKPIYTFI